MRKREYDFLTWTSFPSSAKLICDEPETWVSGGDSPPIGVRPGSTVKITVKAKQENVLYKHSHIHIDEWDGKEWKMAVPLTVPPYPNIPFGHVDWTQFSSAEYIIPPSVTAIIFRPLGGPGSKEAPGVTWFDDLKIYQDGVLIYAEDFSKWDPLIGAGIGAGVLGVVVPAVVRVPEPGVSYEYQKPVLEKEPLLAAGLAGLGALMGGGVGLLTALGIIPVPQIPIPTFGAPLEGPVAPARLGKYLVTG